MAWETGLAGAIGVGLICGGALALWERRKRRIRAAAGDEIAKAELEKNRVLETVIAPMLIAFGICLAAVKFYADYEEAHQPLPPDKAFERAIRNLPRSN